MGGRTRAAGRCARRTGRVRGGLAVTLLALVLATVGLFPTRAASAAPRPYAIVVGDSLVWESADSFRFFANARGWDVTVLSMGGTAPCDWLAPLRQAARVRRPNLVVTSFVGNAFTPCMRPLGVALEGDPLLVKYTWDMLLLRAAVPGAWFAIGTQPPVAAWDVAPLNAAMAGIVPFMRNASVVDLASSVAAPEGTYTPSLPCSPWDGAACVEGQVTVRSPDGVHFCPAPVAPAAGGVVAPCPVASPGATRYAMALAAALPVTPAR